MNVAVVRYYSAVLFVFPIFMFVLLLSPLPVHADGGAPNLAYVAGSAHSISIIDIGQQKIIDTLPVDGDPDTILLSVDGRLLFVTQPALGKLTVIAPKTKQIVCSLHIAGKPSLLTLDPGTNILYVAGNDANTVLGFDPSTCNVMRTLRVNGGVYGVAVAIIGNGISGGNGNQIWIASTHAVTVFDANGRQLKAISLAGNPQYICIPSGPTAYVTTRQGSVEAVDLKSYAVLSTLLSGSAFGPMDYDAVTGQVYVPDLRQKRIDVLLPVSEGVTTRRPVRTLPFDAVPQSIAITSDGQFGFVALADGNVAMLDLPGHQTITTFRVGGSPHFIITGLYPTLFSLTPPQSSILTWLANNLHYIAAGAIVIVIILLIRMPKRPTPPNSKG